MRFLFAAGLLLITVAACKKSAQGVPDRATLNRVGGASFELLPAEGQYPYCLIYSVSRTGLTRQLTMSDSNQSFQCSPGRPVGGRPYKVPLEEGPVRIYVFFTSQSVHAASISQQIIEASNRQALSVMSMRIPGQAALEVLDFTPEEEVAPQVGGLVGSPVDGGAMPLEGDGGQR